MTDTKTITRQPRIFAFIDAENVRNAAEKNGYVDMDYPKLLQWLKQKRSVLKTSIYVGIEAGDTAKHNTFTNLNKPDCIVSMKDVIAYKQKEWLLPTTCPHCNRQFIRRTFIKDKKKANCDTEMTLDIVRLACEDSFDEILVFSGDGDFLKVYEYLVTEKKKRVIVFSSLNPNSRMTNTKIKIADQNGLIGLNDLDGIMPHYAIKRIITP